jgi:hypothetical protein
MLEWRAQAALKDDDDDGWHTASVRFGRPLVAYRRALRMLSLAGLPCSRRPALPALGMVAGWQQ